MDVSTDFIQIEVAHTVAQLQPSVTKTVDVLAELSCIELFHLESILQSPFQIIK